ncbi:hypothetical protein CYMTET_53388, partial [Cymbomonas tetramitiformis]
VGEPSQNLEDNPVSRYDTAMLRASVPDVLRLAIQSAVAQADCAGNAAEQEDSEERGTGTGEEGARTASDALGTLAGEVWATALVLQNLGNVPYEFTENPWDPPEKQVTLRLHAEQFLESCTRQYPALAVCLPVIRAQARRLTTHWTEAHEERVTALYHRIGRHSEGRVRPTWHSITRSLLSPWSQPRAQEVGMQQQKIKAAWRQQARWLRQQVTRLIKAHPLGAVWLVKPTEPFARSERLLIQANTFILMLVMTVWLYYSKSLTCCTNLRTVLSCPEATDVTQPCLGFGFCVDLRDAGALLPAEVRVRRFTCDAFPQNTLTGRFYSMMLIICILSPVTMILSQLYMIAAGTKVPGHWCYRRTRKVEAVFGPKLLAFAQTAAVAAYAIFFNMRKFNKFLAVMFVSIIACLFSSHHIQRFLRACLHVLHQANLAMAHSYRLLRRNMLDTRYEMEEKALTKEEEIIMKVHLVSPLEKSLQRVAYVLLFGMWIIIAWSLFTYSVLIREIMGPETEADVVMQWAITLAVEVFGAQTLQLIALRVCVDAAMMKLERLIVGLNPALLWYEKYIMAISSVEEREADATGDQDMGDDAEADGGDFENSTDTMDSF